MRESAIRPCLIRYLHQLLMPNRMNQHNWEKSCKMTWTVRSCLIFVFFCVYSFVNKQRGWDIVNNVFVLDLQFIQVMSERIPYSNDYFRECCFNQHRMHIMQRIISTLMAIAIRG